MSSSLGEIAKKLILVFGKSPSEGCPSHPPSPPCTAPGIGDSHTWRNAKLSAKTGRQNETPECGGNSTTLQITQQCCAEENGKLCSSLSTWLASKNGVLFWRPGLVTQFVVSPCVRVANSRRRAGGGGGLGSTLAGFPPNTRISFLAISP